MFASQRFVHFLIAAVLLLMFWAGAIAQPVLIGPYLSNGTTPPDAPAPAAAKRAENAEHLQLALRKLEASGPSDSAAAHELAYFQTRDAVLAQQEAVEQQIKDLEVRKVELQTQLKSPAAAGEASATCSFVELDRLKDELAADQARLKLLGDKLAATKAGVEKAQTALEESQAKRRQAQEAFESAKGAPDVGEVANAADQARQAASLAADTLTLRKREVDREQLAHEVQQLAVQLRRQQVARLSPLVVVSEADYKEQIDDIKKKEDAANAWLQRTQAKLQDVNLKLREAQQQYDSETGNRAVAAEELEAQRRAREKLTDEIDSLTQRLQRLAQLRLAWNHRYKIAAADRTNPDRELWGQLKSLQKETNAVLDGLAADLRMEILRMRDLRSSLTSVTKRAEAATDGPEGLRTWLEAQQYQIELTLRIHERNLVMIESSRRLHEKLLDEIGLGVQAISPKTLAMGAWYQADLGVRAIWKRELAHIDEKPITVGNVITGFSILAIGWMLSRFLAAAFANRLLKRFRLSKDGTAAIRTLVFYTLLAIVVLSALRTINVPLTAFTILGGALAIGIGFGSQALINNFIGGLIMLAERPVRLGERITFGSFDGVVEDVGFRCTKLRTMADHVVTIPNSTLVNESIENVARRRTIRRKMDVTITYDTPREKVAAAVQAIRDLLEEKDIRERIHPIIGFEEFPPRVFFNDYNAESLNILVTYWYAPTDWWAYVEHCERVNYRIMEEFARLGVEFAFPSRTVYVKNLDNRSPADEPSRNGTKAYAAAPNA